MVIDILMQILAIIIHSLLLGASKHLSEGHQLGSCDDLLHAADGCCNEPVTNTNEEMGSAMEAGGQ